MTESIKKQYRIRLTPKATLNEIIVVLNSLGIATFDKEMADKFREYNGIEIREGSVIDGTIES